MSSPIERYMCNLGLDEFIAWHDQEPGSAQGDQWHRLARPVGVSGPWCGFDQRPNHSGSRTWAVDGADSGLLAPELLNGVYAHEN